MKIKLGSGVYASDDQSVIDCIIVIYGQEHPYSARSREPSTEDVFNALVSGDAGEIAPYTPPEPQPEPVPESVTRRQILTGLAVVGWITEAEALAALTIGATPAAVDAVIAALPAGQQFATRMKWAGFQTAFRDDEMVAALAVVEGKTSQEIDEFFRLCAGIA